MSIIPYMMIRRHAEEMEKEYEEKMARLDREMEEIDAWKKARNPWLYCDHACYVCEKDTFESCKYSLKDKYNRYSNPI